MYMSQLRRLPPLSYRCLTNVRPNCHLRVSINCINKNKFITQGATNRRTFCTDTDKKEKRKAKLVNEQGQVLARVISIDGVQEQLTQDELKTKQAALPEGLTLKKVSAEPLVFRVFSTSDLPKKEEKPAAAKKFAPPPPDKRRRKPEKGVNERGKKDGEIKCSVKISEHDLYVKLKNALRMVKKGSDVKFTVELAASEKAGPASQEARAEVLESVIEGVEGLAEASAMTHEGRRSYVKITQL